MWFVCVPIRVCTLVSSDVACTYCVESNCGVELGIIWDDDEVLYLSYTGCQKNKKVDFIVKYN